MLVLILRSFRTPQLLCQSLVELCSTLEHARCPRLSCKRKDGIEEAGLCRGAQCRILQIRNMSARSNRQGLFLVLRTSIENVLVATSNLVRHSWAAFRLALWHAPLSAVTCCAQLRHTRATLSSAVGSAVLKCCAPVCSDVHSLYAITCPRNNVVAEACIIASSQTARSELHALAHCTA